MTQEEKKVCTCGKSEDGYCKCESGEVVQAATETEVGGGCSCQGCNCK